MLQFLSAERVMVVGLIFSTAYVLSILLMQPFSLSRDNQFLLFANTLIWSLLYLGMVLQAEEIPTGTAASFYNVLLTGALCTVLVSFVYFFFYHLVYYSRRRYQRMMLRAQQEEVARQSSLYKYSSVEEDEVEVTDLSKPLPLPDSMTYLSIVPSNIPPSPMSTQEEAGLELDKLASSASTAEGADQQTDSVVSKVAGVDLLPATPAGYTETAEEGDEVQGETGPTSD